MRKMKFLLVWFILLMAIGFSVVSKSDVLDTDEVKVWVADFVIERWICKAPRRKLCKDRAERDRVARLFASASTNRKVPIILLVNQAYFESSLDWTQVGPSGEIGYLQVLPGGGHDVDCDLTTEIGSLDCGAKGMRTSRKNCKNWYGGLMEYKTGHCESKKMGIVSKIVYRLEWWLKLRKKITDIQKEIEAQAIQEEEMEAADVPECLKDEDTDPLGWE